LLRKNVETGLNVLRLWSIVPVANVVGTHLLALCIAKIAIFDPRVQQAFSRISQERLRSSFGMCWFAPFLLVG
jgi:formate/nitrite transporter FocA (FNT family)